MGKCTIGACFAVVGVFFSSLECFPDAEGFLLLFEMCVYEKKRYKNCLPIKIWHEKRREAQQTVMPIKYVNPERCE